MSRGGQQVIPRPSSHRAGQPNPWIGTLNAEHLGLERVERVLSHHRADPSAFEVLPPRRGGPNDFRNRRSAVLAPLYVADDGLTHVVLTRRSSGLRAHKGEVSFPGGRVDDGEDTLAAALREAHEEIGLPGAAVRIIGQLESLATIVSNSAITPYVGALTHLPLLSPNPIEVERVFSVSLLELATDPDCYREEIWEYEDGTFPNYFFEVEGDTIWGATGRLLQRLLTLLAAGVS